MGTGPWGGGALHLSPPEIGMLHYTGLQQLGWVGATVFWVVMLREVLRVPYLA